MICLDPLPQPVRERARRLVVIASRDDQGQFQVRVGDKGLGLHSVVTVYLRRAALLPGRLRAGQAAHAGDHITSSGTMEP
jgi:hypothetical protein